MIAVAPHPLLDAAAFITRYEAPLGELPSPAITQPPAAASDTVRGAVRDLLRWGGFKPSGRSKPSSEYLRNAAAAGPLAAINAAVDTCNAVSLATGLPISVIDLDRSTAPLHIAVAGPGTRYVFNPSGQEIDVSGLVCLFDAGGPCANAVKDAQRTKTHEATRTTLSIVWGTNALPGHTEATVAWYQELLAQVGTTEPVALDPA